MQSSLGYLNYMNYKYKNYCDKAKRLVEYAGIPKDQLSVKIRLMCKGVSLAILLSCKKAM